MSRGVEAGNRVLREQESDRQEVDPEEEPTGLAVVEARVVQTLAEYEAEVLMSVRDDHEERDDHRDSDHVPPHGDVVDHRQEIRAEDVDDRGGDQDDREEEERLGEDVLGVAEVDPEDVHPVGAERHVQEAGARVLDRRDHADQPEEVEPAGPPGPFGPAQLAGEPVDAAGRWVLGDQLRQREADDQDQGRDDRPAP